MAESVLYLQYVHVLGTRNLLYFGIGELGRPQTRCCRGGMASSHHGGPHVRLGPSFCKVFARWFLPRVLEGFCQLLFATGFARFFARWFLPNVLLGFCEVGVA